MSADQKKSPLTGYNHNLKYKGRVYHVQTEDSGLQSPHLFTHLFHDGTIVATQKTDYTHLVERPDWDEQVRRLMQEQHKNMMKSLLRGLYDAKIVQYFGTLEISEAQPSPPAPPPAAAGPPPTSPQSAPAPTPAPAPAARPAPGAPPAPVAAPPPVRAPASSSNKAGSGSAPADRRPRRSAVVSAPVVVITGANTGGDSRSSNGRRQQRPTQPIASPGAYSATPPSSSRQEMSSRHRRGAPNSPELKPEESTTIPDSIFGDVNMVNEKSLDEVILAYLSEDLPDD
jgi:hypothetical protein